MTAETLLAQYGYAAVVAGAILEGETVLLVAAVFVQQGLLDFRSVLLASALGAFAGDQFFFHLGRCRGADLFRHRPAWQRKLDRAGRILSYRRELVILCYRFFYGMRAVIPFLLGAGRCPIALFTILSALSATAWALLIGSGGYCFGEAFGRLFERGLALQQWVLGGFFFLLLVAAGVRFWRNR